MQVNAVEQRAGQSGLIAACFFTAVAATALRVTEVTARAGIHRSDQLKGRREGGLPRRPGNTDFAGFKRLAQHLKDAAIKLRNLVKEKHPVMGHGNFPGAGIVAAADHGDGRGGVMGAAKRGQIELYRRARPMQRVNCRHVQSLLLVKRRQQAGQATGQQTLATARRAAKQNIVSILTFS